MESESAGSAPEFLCGRYALNGSPRNGAQASVVQAYDTKCGRVVAIKRLKGGPSDERAREGLQREFTILEELKHPNIVDLLDVDRDGDGNWFLVLEWVPETLDDVIARQGPSTWAEYWDRIGRCLLDAVVFAQKKQIAHRDIKPKNILMTAGGTPKLADYGIAKLLDRIGAWAPSTGYTFRFDYTPGYTPTEPDSAEHSLSRDCFAFAAVAVGYIAGRSLESDEDRAAALEEAVLPPSIRSILERCLASDPKQRPQLALILQAQIDGANAREERNLEDGQIRHLSLFSSVANLLERKLELHTPREIERFVLEELGETCSILVDENAPPGDLQAQCDLVGPTWRFRARRSGRHGESLALTAAHEIGAALASEQRDLGVRRKLRFTFDRPADLERVGKHLSLLFAEAADYQKEQAAERQARDSQRVFRVWRSYLRNRADFEAKRANAITYVNRRVDGDRITFTTELAQNDDLVGQDRMVLDSPGRLTGRVTSVVFNQVTIEVNSGDAAKAPRRGKLAINTIAATRALDHQSSALDAVFYDRAGSGNLKSILLDPRTATPVAPIDGVEPTDEDFDEEKRSILASALGVQDILAIEGPPGTGKTKLITEIVVQWLRRNPGHRILLSSQTHIALDNVLERVAELDASLDMIRIGRPEDPRISPASKKLLLEHRVEGWIAQVRRDAEADMGRWADENGVDRNAVAVGMKVERLKQVLSKSREMRAYIASREAERDGVEQAAHVDGEETNLGEIEEETTQIDSEIGNCRQALKAMLQEEKDLRAALSKMGEYASGLATSNDDAELGDWASHLLADEPTVKACRDRLELLESWQLRAGRSPDFNVAMLASAKIIAGTCVGIAGVKGMTDVGYDLCVIDEASKATATEMLIPMARSKRWIVVGDPKQLPPFFEDFEEELEKEFPKDEVRSTLLDRLLDESIGLPDGCRAAIKNQYRMIKPIGDLISECFYAGKLNSPKTTHGLKLNAAISKPVTWYSTHRLAHRSERPEGKTFFNTAEVSQVAAVLRRLEFVAKAQRLPISVAVIAGYTAQVQLLNDLVSQGVSEWPNLDISCNSVDAFQGRQADVCIYSVVRSNSQDDLGFLREKPRLNVALSRGKSALVIVGDFAFCQKARGKNPFRSVANYIERNEKDCAVEVLA